MSVETGGWVTVTEGAALLGVSRSRVLRALRWGVLSGRRERRNLWLVDGEALMVWSLGLGGVGAAGGVGVGGDRNRLAQPRPAAHDHHHQKNQSYARSSANARTCVQPPAATRV